MRYLINLTAYLSGYLGDIDEVFDGVRRKLRLLNALGFLCGLLLWGFFNLIMLMFGMGDFYPLSKSSGPIN